MKESKKDVAYRRGQVSYEEGTSWVDNPYCYYKERGEFLAWQNGWQDAEVGVDTNEED